MVNHPDSAFIKALGFLYRREGKLEDDIRLHQERGVYNAYMKLPKAKAQRATGF